MATVRIKSSRVPKSKKKVQFKVEVKGELNITEFVARQQVNNYLFTHIGNMLHAGNPDLLVGDGFLQWDVPVVYSLPDLGELGTAGHILVDAQNGDLKLKESTSRKTCMPSSCMALMTNLIAEQNLKTTITREVGPQATSRFCLLKLLLC